MQVGVNHLKCASKSTRTHEHMYAHLFAPDKLYMYLYETNISNAFNNHIDPQLCTCALIIIFRMTFHCVKKDVLYMYMYMRQTCSCIMDVKPAEGEN